MLRYVFKRKRLPQMFARTVAVHTKDGHTIEGIILGTYADAITVGHASIYGGETGTLKLEGDQVIPIENVSFMQELTPSSPRESAPA